MGIRLPGRHDDAILARRRPGGASGDRHHLRRSPGRERTVRGRDGFAFTAPVGSFDSPNPFGLEDMHGNVAEWCLDWYGESYYATSPASDPKSPRAGSFRVIRGGGWDYYPVYCRSAYRVVVTSSYRSDSVGFRVVQERAVRVVPGFRTLSRCSSVL